MNISAKRFRALVACPSIQMQGSAGVNPTNGERRYLDEPGSVHFGAVFMPQGVAKANPTWGRFAITALADDIIACEGGDVPDVVIGVSEDVDAARFDALMRCPRINLHCHNGTEIAPDRIETDHANPGTFSFSAEFWPSGVPHSSGQDDPTTGRACLVALADDLIELRKRTPGGMSQHRIPHVEHVETSEQVREDFARSWEAFGAARFPADDPCDEMATDEQVVHAVIMQHVDDVAVLGTGDFNTLAGFWGVDRRTARRRAYGVIEGSR